MKTIEWTYHSGIGGFVFYPSADRVVLRHNHGYSLYAVRANRGLQGITASNNLEDLLKS